MLANIDKSTAQAANYGFEGITMIILVARLVASRFQPQPFDISFFVVVLALVVLIARALTSHFSLTLGTASDLVTLIAEGGTATAAQLASAKAGTEISIANRVLETTFWWSQSTLLLLLYKRLVAHIKWTKAATIGTWAFLGLSYVGTVVTIFVECHPFHLYWQTSPDPGKCVKAYRTTVIQCTSLIILDLALMVIASPVLFVKGRRTVQRVRIAGLFALGILCTVFSCLRMVYIFAEDSAQAGRIFWSGLLVMVCAFVANAPIIYGSITLFTKNVKSSAAEKYVISGQNPSKGTKGAKSGLDTNVHITTTYHVTTEAGSEEKRVTTVAEQEVV
ncbi:hypothetical protein ANO11243_093220 [Dothideomycetidae sp. 11243]|nr:hypothetical protein ANO11243_093220 [fungal sp. No.11243]